jgi:hypothetical protein
MFDGAIMELELHLEILQNMPKSRELALAITKLEECIMWLKAARPNTGGIVPPHITDKIAGHEGDQP